MISKIRNKKLRNAVLRDFSLNDCLYRGIKEMAVNTVNKTIKLTAIQKRKLRKHKKAISQFVCKTTDRRKRRRLVKQSGGFLPILVPIIAQLLASTLSGNGVQPQSRGDTSRSGDVDAYNDGDSAD